jgi:hypothetical protein
LPEKAKGPLVSQRASASKRISVIVRLRADSCRAVRRTVMVAMMRAMERRNERHDGYSVVDPAGRLQTGP